MDAFLQAEKDKMQKKIAELQNSVEMWKTQAKELQKQLMELSTKSPREKRRPPLKVNVIHKFCICMVAISDIAYCDRLPVVSRNIYWDLIRIVYHDIIQYFC